MQTTVRKWPLRVFDDIMSVHCVMCAERTHDSARLYTLILSQSSGENVLY